MRTRHSANGHSTVSPFIRHYWPPTCLASSRGGLTAPPRPANRIRLHTLDNHLLRPPDGYGSAQRFGYAVEFLFFGIKEARARLFAGLFCAAIFTTPRAGILGIPRYDVLLFVALAIQAWMICSKLEMTDELKEICLFHPAGFALEMFKTSSGIKSWAHPDFGHTKVLGVPLFSGFMYAVIGRHLMHIK